MDDFLKLLYDYYIYPEVENKYLPALSDFIQDMPDPKAKECVQVVGKYTTQAFLLGVRTGAGLEQFLHPRPAPNESV